MLEKVLAFGTVVVALTIEDRERLLRALDDVRTDAWPSFVACLAGARGARARGIGLSLDRVCRWSEELVCRGLGAWDAVARSDDLDRWCRVADLGLEVSGTQ